MKKLFTLAFAMFFNCAMTFAQSDFEFVDGSGNVIANGSTFYANGKFDDWGDEFLIDSGVLIKNNTGNTAKVTLNVSVKKHTEGMLYMVCPGGTCNSVEPGSPITKEFDAHTSAPEPVAIHCDYYEGTSGKSELELVLLQGGKEYSKIIVAFVTHDLAGIDSVISDNALCNVYDITGKLVKANVSKQSVNSMNKGLYIVRELTGAKKANKVIVK